MKIYNFLFHPDLNNLRLNMDASLVDPLEKGKNIELFDRDVIFYLFHSVRYLNSTNRYKLQLKF